MVLSPNSNLQRRAGNTHALVTTGTSLPRPNASVPADGCHTTPSPRPNASVPAVGFGAGRYESEWKHRSMCRRHNSGGIHVSNNDFCGDASSSRTYNGGCHIVEIVRNCCAFMWISMYYMPIALAHLGRIFTRSAPAKMHILLFEVAKKMTVDHLCRKNLLHFFQITCIWRETDKLLVNLHDREVQGRAQLQVNTQMLHMKWKAIHIDRNARRAENIKLANNYMRWHQENVISSDTQVRNLCYVHIAISSAQHVTALRKACVLFLKAKAHPAAEFLSERQSGWAEAPKLPHGVQMGENPRHCQHPACRWH